MRYSIAAQRVQVPLCAAVGAGANDHVVQTQLVERPARQLRSGYLWEHAPTGRTPAPRPAAGGRPAPPPLHRPSTSTSTSSRAPASLSAGRYAPPLHIAPAAGSFLLFPSWLMHRVLPHGLADARMSVSFNVWLSDEDGGGIDAVERLFDGLFAVG